MERTLLIKNEDGDFELTFPSLHGTGRCLGRLKANQQTWEICVNPFLKIFEARPSMRLQIGCKLKIPRLKATLDFGWKNFEFALPDRFKRAGTTETSLKQQNIHSDHRREVERGLFSPSGEKFNQDHVQWKTAEEWRAAGKKCIPVPKVSVARPRSFLGPCFLPKTSIQAIPKGGGTPVSTAVPLGCFFCFDGHVCLHFF